MLGFEVQNLNSKVLVFFFFSALLSVSAAEVRKLQWEEYKTWAQSHVPAQDVAMAVSPNGSIGYATGFWVNQAKSRALYKCKWSPLNISNQSCEIIDVNLQHKSLSGRHDLSKADSRRLVKVWCATETSVSYIPADRCKGFGQSFETLFEAQKFKSASNSGSSKGQEPESGYWCVSSSNFWPVKNRTLCRDGNSLTQNREQAHSEYLKKKEQTLSGASGFVWCAKEGEILRTTASACQFSGGLKFTRRQDALESIEKQKLVWCVLGAAQDYVLQVLSRGACAQWQGLPFQTDLAANRYRENMIREKSSLAVNGSRDATHTQQNSANWPFILFVGAIGIFIVWRGFSSSSPRRSSGDVHPNERPVPESDYIYRPSLSKVAVDASSVNDAFTGAPLQRGLGLYQCSGCESWYHEASVRALRTENQGKCINCESYLIMRFR